jgi:hypothetical protein
MLFFTRFLILQYIIDNMKSEVLQHSLYSPEWATSDFQLQGRWGKHYEVGKSPVLMKWWELCMNGSWPNRKHVTCYSDDITNHVDRLNSLGRRAIM